ncbi:hypothetical protein ACN26Y_29805 [Micromonospora sp. WMMD558]|uniref:hypothetical protein n=1 Tax=Micromonospora sp. WMMD558 TaxID=3403462 RepID=UPI003BF53618
MSRRERWWRPAVSTRPATRTRRRVRMVSEDQAARSYELGYEAGQRDEAKRARQRDDLLHRLADACNEGPEAVSELAAQWGFGQGDDLLDFADAAGVTPLADVDPGELVADLEAWLRDGGQC